MQHKKILIFSSITIAVFLLIVYLMFSINNYNIKVIDKFTTKCVSETELEKIVGIEFTEDNIDGLEISLQVLNNGSYFPNDLESFYASDTSIKILYEVSTETLKKTESYLETWDSIIDRSCFSYEMNCDLEYLKRNYNIDENNIKYVNVQYGTCRYDITKGINEVDYYMYVYIINIDKDTSKIFISGRYPYPIELLG